MIFKREKQKISKKIRYNFLSTQNIEDTNIVDIKSVITEHPKASHKLTKIIGKGENVGSNSSYIVIQKKLKTF